MQIYNWALRNLFLTGVAALSIAAGVACNNNVDIGNTTNNSSSTAAQKSDAKQISFRPEIEKEDLNMSQLSSKYPKGAQAVSGFQVNFEPGPPPRRGAGEIMDSAYAKSVVTPQGKR